MSGQAGGPRFRDWLSCPACSERDHLSTLAYATDLVIECYSCGLICKYVVGQDISLEGLDVEAIARVAGEADD